MNIMKKALLIFITLSWMSLLHASTPVDSLVKKMQQAYEHGVSHEALDYCIDVIDYYDDKQDRYYKWLYTIKYAEIERSALRLEEAQKVLQRAEMALDAKQDSFLLAKLYNR